MTRLWRCSSDDYVRWVLAGMMNQRWNIPKIVSVPEEVGFFVGIYAPLFSFSIYPRAHACIRLWTDPFGMTTKTPKWLKGSQSIFPPAWFTRWCARVSQIGQIHARVFFRSADRYRWPPTLIGQGHACGRRIDVGEPTNSHLWLLRCWCCRGSHGQTELWCVFH